MADQHSTSYGTGFQQTTIEPLEAPRVRWTRIPGINNRDGFQPPPADFAQTLAPLRDTSAEFLAPIRASHREVVWEADGAASFAAVVRSEPGSDLARDGVQQLATSLRAFHQRPADVGAVDTAPPSLQRFSGWLADGAGSRASRPWRVHLRSQLGTERWELLLQATDALIDGCQRSTGGCRRLHGWMSLGNVVVAEGAPGIPARLQVLSGTDLGRGSVEVDLTCLLGELAEFSLRAEHFGEDAKPMWQLADLFTAQYGDGLDARLLAQGTAVRVALHSCDFATFLGWHDDLNLYPGMVSELLDAVPAAG